MADSRQPSPIPRPADPSAGDLDPAEVLRGRSAETRAERDEAIAQLRETMTDEEILDTFGIDLPEIER